MTGDWVNSLERDVEIIEGQIALSDALGGNDESLIGVPVERLKRFLESAHAELKTPFDKLLEADLTE